MGFPSVYGGVLPLVVVNTAISLAVVRNLLDGLLRIVGLKRDDDQHQHQQHVMDASPWYNYQQEQQQQQQQHQSSASFVEEIQLSLPLVQFSDLNPAEMAAPSSSEGVEQQQQQQCAVCLSELEASHLVRKLPHCSHVFHRECVDKWLNHNQTTCPMCRSSLLNDELARRHRQQEEVLAEELALWLSVYHTSALSRGPWWYRGHGSGFASGWDFH